MFVIYSLPRSGSAWLSTFLTYGPSYCFHDPLAECSTVAQLAALLITRQEDRVGFVDTGAYLFRDGIKRLKLDEYVLIRDRKEIDKSLFRIGLAANYDVNAEYKRLLKATVDAKPIYYDRLGNLAYLKQVWQMIVGDGFDAQRSSLLSEMNIQRKLDYLNHITPAHFERLRADCRSTH